MEVDKAIKERHTVRNFKEIKKPRYQDIIEAIDAANRAPLAGNVACLRYIVVQDKEIIHKLAEAAAQDFFQDLDFVVVVCSDKAFLKRSYLERADMYAKQQVGAAIENLLLKVTDMGLASCWVGAFSDPTVRDALDIPDNIDIEALLPIGYEMGRGKQKTKPLLDTVLFFDKWKNKFMKPRRITAGSKT